MQVGDCRECSEKCLNISEFIDRKCDKFEKTLRAIQRPLTEYMIEEEGVYDFYEIVLFNRSAKMKRSALTLLKALNYSVEENDLPFSVLNFISDCIFGSRHFSLKVNGGKFNLSNTPNNISMKEVVEAIKQHAKENQ